MEEIVKRGRGRPVGTGGNKREDYAVHTNKGDNSKYLEFSMKVASLPKIKTDDPEQVDKRATEYIKLCIENDIKPTVSGLALSMGLDRHTLSDWNTGKTRATTHTSTIKKYYGIMENMMEEYMLNGKINPVAGIFLMKNNHGYRDQSEITVTPNNPLGDETDAATLEQKYVEAAKPDDYCEAEGFEVE